MASIQFGTSGWRAIIGEEFTFRNVEVLTQAIGEYVREQASGAERPQVVIGYDGRFLSDRFAGTVALTLLEQGVDVWMPHRPVPTPVVAHLIQTERLAGGVIVTASHNPPEYNGLKFNPASASPAPPEVTEPIQARANELRASGPSDPLFPVTAAEQESLLHQAAEAGRLRWYDPYTSYRQRVFQIVRLDVLRQAGLKVATDVFYGAAREYYSDLLREAGCTVQTLHEEPNPLFGGRRPDPVGENLQELETLVRESDAVLGLAVDGDADRFGIVDGDGTYIHANYILALVLDYLAESRGWKGIVVRSFVTSHLIDAVAEYHGLEVVETPTGFKFIGGALNEDPQRFVLGGEESNGLTVRHHVPEKDGMIAGLLVAEMVAAKGESLAGCLQELFSRVGERYVDRLDLELPEDRKAALLQRLQEDPPRNFGGYPVVQTHPTLRHKFILANGGFVALRPSGTEPLIRCYLDAPTPESLEAIAQDVQDWISQV